MEGTNAFTVNTKRPYIHIRQQYYHTNCIIQSVQYLILTIAEDIGTAGCALLSPRHLQNRKKYLEYVSGTNKYSLARVHIVIHDIVPLTKTLSYTLQGYV